MPRTSAQFPPEFRHEALGLVRCEVSIEQVAPDAGVSQQALPNRRREARCRRRSRRGAGQR